MNKLITLLVLSLLGCASSFSTSPVRVVVNGGTTTRSTSSRLYSTQRNEDFPPDGQEEYTGSVDWDAEWKKVVANEGKTSSSKIDRPGKDFYKSEAEIAAIKAANKAAEKATEASRSVANMTPDIRSLSGDWKVRGDLENLFRS